MSSAPIRGSILIIDDQEPTRYVFRRVLTGAGYQVVEADNGADGLARSLQLPDVIIADVNLPDMLGYDLVRRLKSNPVTSNIPVLQISATFISDESKVQALEGGADSYLIQPVDQTVLIAQIQAFSLAQGFGVPIVPISIVGSYEFFQTGNWILYPGKITVYLHDTIETSGLGRADIDRLRQRVQDMVAGPVEDALKSWERPRG